MPVIKLNGCAIAGLMLSVYWASAAPVKNAPSDFNMNLYWYNVTCNPETLPNKTMTIPCTTTAKSQTTTTVVTADGEVTTKTDATSADPMVWWHSVTTMQPNGDTTEYGNVTFGTTADAAAQHTFTYVGFNGAQSGVIQKVNSTMNIAGILARVTGGTGMFANAIGFHTWACGGAECWSSTTIHIP